MYKLRDDICVAEVDNIYLFIALRSAWDECPFAVQAAPVLVYIFNLLRSGYSDDEIIIKLIKEKKYTQERSERIFNNFKNKAKGLHYLIEENEQ